MAPSGGPHFDDLTDDLRDTPPARVGPKCTGEKMALHLMINHSRANTANRPKAVQNLVAHLLQYGADYDWRGCSNL
ncbi:hypothetical protein [Streptomyces sp. NPDC046939]|uniref:hypothetical protein n=1 Tax=Streptomyces sp. NPDC046939 TaxID=3155376 RepID=UPI0033F4E786